VAIRRSTLDILVGAVAVLAWAGFVAFAFTVNQQHISGYTLYATFAHIDGLSAHADVRLAGIRIGEVSEASFLPQSEEARITMVVQPGYVIPTDSAAIVASDGIFGGKFIKIDPGGDSESLKPGASFGYVQDSVDFEHLLQHIVQAAEAQRKSAQKTPAKSE
jgi:phospholipid/cholesterol/gamma-HCH transport system substrate-binding protein